MSASPRGESDDADPLPAAVPQTNGSDTERQAIESVRHGDVHAFRVLVERYQQRLFALALMITRERPAAEEVTQDAFLNAYRHIGRYDVRRPFYPWLASIAVRLAQTWLRRHAIMRLRANPAPAALPDPGDGVTGNHPLQALVADEQGRRLWSNVQALTSGERTAVLLYYRQQFSVDEIATQLGVTTGTVKTLLFRARRKLRDRLAAESDTTSRKRTP